MEQRKLFWGRVQGAKGRRDKLVNEFEKTLIKVYFLRGE